MISKHNINSSVWVDLASPSKEELELVSRDYDLENLIKDDLAVPTPKSRNYEGNKFLYAVFHIPIFKHSGKDRTQEIDFCIGRHVLVTARYDAIDALHKFEKETEVEEILGKSEFKHSHIFFHMMSEIQASLSDELSYMSDWIMKIEDSIFKGKEKEMVFAISEASRNMLNFRKIIEPHLDSLRFLKTEGEKRFGPSFKTGSLLLIENLERINAIAKNNLDMLIELRETNNSLLSTKQNEVMKTLTVLAFMTIPASVIASIFNMSVDLPLVDRTDAFWIIIGGMIGLSLCMFTFFKIKKWL